MVSYKKFLIPCVAIVAVITMGCSLTDKIKESVEREVTEGVVENIIGDNVDLETDEDGNVTVTTEDGSFSTDSKSLEKVQEYIDIPTWIKYDEEQGDYIMKNISDDGLSLSGILHSEKSLDDTYNYWVDYFESEGYEDISKTDMSGFYSIYGYKQDSTISLSISVSEDSDDPDNVSVVLSYTDSNITE